MALLNKLNIHYFGHYGPELRLGSSLFSFYDLDDTDYWYIDFHHGWHLIPAIDFIPSEIKDRIREGDVILLLNNSHEAYHDSIEFIYRYFIMDLNFPPTSIRLLTESASIMEEVDRVSTVFNKPYIQVEWLRIFEYNVKNARNIENYRKLNTLEIKQYDKKYLNLNRRWRQHRPILVGLLELHNLLDKGHVSFCKNVDGQNWDSVYGYLQGSVQYCDPELYNLFQSNRDRIESIPDMFLDTPELYVNQVQVDNNLDYYYENTYFSIVNETNYFKDLGEGLFLSEKVFKPILRCHPFILVSRPHSLRKLKELGYKTFSPYIDESYDEEVDDYLRLKMIVNEVERLSNLSEPQLVEFLTAVKEIVEYNYQLLTNKSSALKDNFVTALT
jgi:hypothetical protein